MRSVLRGTITAFTVLTLWVGYRVALADLYGYVDETGRAHISTAKLDERYTLFKRTPSKSVNDSDKRPRVTAKLKVPDIPQNRVKRYRKHISKVAKQYDLDPALIHAIIAAESLYDPAAVSQRGASGLMQLMPDTAQRYRIRNVFDPEKNILGGARYLRYLLKLFNGDLELALAAYNAGENAVIKYGWKIPPYPETVQYVPKVLAYYKKYQQKI